MKEGSSIEKHLQRMKKLTARLAAIGAPIAEEDQLVILLGSLPKSYSIMVTVLESRSDNVSLDYVQQALVLEEQKLHGVGRSNSPDVHMWRKRTQKSAIQTITDSYNRETC